MWLVNDGGKPLSAPGGRAKFYKAGTSTPETVYSDIDLTDATAYGTEAATDKLGYLPAIWLKTDRLYKVVVEQRIQEDPEEWVTLWEVDNVGYIDPNESGGDSSSIVTVSNITGLKALDHSLNGYVMVQGYYASGDWGTPSMFVYDPECTEAADDGAYVKPNDVLTAGRWVQLFDDSILDVRKFGAIPDRSQNSDVQGKVVNAVNYAQDNSTRTRPLTVGFMAPGYYDFVGNFDFSQYSFTDLTDNSTHRVKWFINAGVVFRNIGETTNKFTLEKDTVCIARETLVSGVTTLEVEGGGSIKVDPAWWGTGPCTLENCYVVCGSVTTNNKEFTKCHITSDRKLDGNVTLDNCGFSQSWFKDGFAYGYLTLLHTEYGVHDCYTAGDYVAIKNALHDSDYGDLGEQEISNVTLLDGAIVENALFSLVTLAGDAELHNVSGSLAISASATTQNWVDCWVTVNAAVTVDSLSLRRGKLEGQKVSVLSDILVHDANVSTQIDVLGGTIDMRRCTVDAKITQKDDGGVIAGVIEGCTLNAAHELDPVTAGTVVNFVWKDNYASVNPITIVDRSKLATLESSHGYVYTNNGGSFLPGADEFTKDAELTITDDPSLWSSSGYIVGRNYDALCGGKQAAIFFANKVNDSYHGINGVDLFRIGTDSFHVKCDWFPYLVTNSGMRASDIIPQTFMMMARKIPGQEKYIVHVPTVSSAAEETVNPTVIGFVQYDLTGSVVTVLLAGSVKGKFKFSKVMGWEIS